MKGENGWAGNPSVTGRAIVPGGRPAPSSRSRGGVLNVSLTKLWALMDGDLPGVAVSPSQKDPPPDRCG